MKTRRVRLFFLAYCKHLAYWHVSRFSSPLKATVVDIKFYLPYFPNCEPLYVVSHVGELMSVTTMAPVSHINSDGYREIHIAMKNQKEYVVVYFHNLVWMSVMKRTIPIGYEIDHIDNNRSNNHIDNLQLLTKSDNQTKKKPAGSPNYCTTEAAVYIPHPLDKLAASWIPMGDIDEGDFSFEMSAAGGVRDVNSKRPTSRSWM